jgi:hypothetical protein
LFTINVLRIIAIINNIRTIVPTPHLRAHIHTFYIHCRSSRNITTGFSFEANAFTNDVMTVLKRWSASIPGTSGTIGCDPILCQYMTRGVQIEKGEGIPITNSRLGIRSIMRRPFLPTLSSSLRRHAFNRSSLSVNIC